MIATIAENLLAILAIMNNLQLSYGNQVLDWQESQDEF